MLDLLLDALPPQYIVSIMIEAQVPDINRLAVNRRAYTSIRGRFKNERHWQRLSNHFFPLVARIDDEWYVQYSRLLWFMKNEACVTVQEAPFVGAVCDEYSTKQKIFRNNQDFYRTFSQLITSEFRFCMDRYDMHDVNMYLCSYGSGLCHARLITCYPEMNGYYRFLHDDGGLGMFVTLGIRDDDDNVIYSEDEESSSDLFYLTIVVTVSMCTIETQLARAILNSTQL